MKKLIAVLVVMLIGSSVFAGGIQNRKKVVLHLDPHPEFAWFGVDLYGNPCRGGLYLDTPDGLRFHSKMILKNGPKMTKDQYRKKLKKVLVRQYQIMNGG